MTQLYRDYEKSIEAKKKEFIEKAKQQNQVVASTDEKQATTVAASVAAGQVDAAQVNTLRAKAVRLNQNLAQSIAALELDKRNIKELMLNLKMDKSAVLDRKKLSQETLKDQAKGQVVDYPANKDTFLKKITDLASNQKLTQDSHRLELAINDAFLQSGGLSSEVQDQLKLRSQVLSAIIKFNDNTKNRPGCYLYERNEINDRALTLDSDPKKNFDLNFKNNIMSTLSHELGHAFGLLHNFKASTDKANYEFPGETATGRNYSSIMDYIADIDMKYAGPGPYDAHALRAAYTGSVELSAGALNSPAILQQLKVTSGNYTTIDNVVLAMKKNSLVHYTKETVNKLGFLKYYEQCDDGGLGASSLCAQFDSGGSATDIVKNFTADYTRGYAARNYVYDKISFGWPQKIQAIQRNITLFSNIHSFLNEALMTVFVGPGRTAPENAVVKKDVVMAARLGYNFFHELIRTPDASGISLMDTDRLIAVPYKYQKTVVDAQGAKTDQSVDDVRIVEARSVKDVIMTRDKFDTIGIGFDKEFALQFLMQSSASRLTDDSQVSMISYIDFEQIFMGVSDPSESITIRTILDILSDNLKVGFFAPSDSVADTQFMSINAKVDINRDLYDQTAVASIISLTEAKWKNFDPFAETFKISRSSQKSAPKDRFSVARAGQDRALSDTRVFFASQNANAASALIKSAARNELFILNKKALFEAMKQIYLADIELKKPIAAAIATACAVNDAGTVTNADACTKIKALTLADHLTAIPQLAPLKAKVDGASQNLVKILRALNSKELIMAKELDKPDVAQNFDRQVEVLRSMLSTQISMINDVLLQIQNAKPENLQTTINAAAQSLSESRKKNDILANIPLLAVGQNFIAEYASTLSVKLQGSAEEVTGAQVANILVDASKLQDQSEKQLDVIEKLSTYTGLVDPDTVHP